MDKASASIKKISENWKEIRKEILDAPTQAFLQEVKKKTPQSTYARYGKRYKNFPNFGLMSKLTSINVTGESMDLVQYRISTPQEYADEVIDYPPETRWTTPGTGPHWFDWAWDTTNKNFEKMVEGKMEQLLGSKIEEGL